MRTAGKDFFFCVSAAGRVLLDFLFPISCVSCGKGKTYCCEQCLAKIPVIRESCHHESIIAAAHFREKSPLADLIHRFKYDGAREISMILVALFAEEVEKNILALRPAVLVPVPLHPRRLRFRGFNQSLVLANQLSKKFDVEISDVLCRTRYTRPQVELGRDERITNVRGAFELQKQAPEIAPKITYLLVDDVCTTGSTLNECAGVLRKNGAENVVGLVIGRAVAPMSHRGINGLASLPARPSGIMHP